MPPLAINIGILHDGPSVQLESPVIRGMQLKLEEFNAQGGVEGREVEMVHTAANAAHEGLPENATTAWEDLASDPGVVGILGPAIADNALAVIDTVDLGEVPTINWSGAEETRGEWFFHFQAGSLPDEGVYLARLIKKLGHQTVGVLKAGTVGEKYYAYFNREATAQGLEIVSVQSAHVHATDVTPQLTRIRRASPECVIFLGMAEPTLAFGRGFRALDWQTPRFSNIAMLALAFDAEAAAINEGIVWTDQYEPRNPALATLIDAYAKRYGEPPVEAFVAPIGYDMMTLMLAGLCNASNLTRVGLKEGLERVKPLPCATGGLNPVMGFGPWDRAAIKGPDLLMFRTVRNGKLVTFGG